MWCSAVAQAAGELELLRTARPAGDADARAPAVQRIRLQQRVRGRDLDVVLGPVDGVGEVQRRASRPAA